MKTAPQAASKKAQPVSHYLNLQAGSPTQKQGLLAEDYAAAFLQQQGLTLVARNYRCRSGEIDLIAAEGDELVFVEVRQRHSASDKTPYGGAMYSVTPSKIKRVAKAAAHYLQTAQANNPCRIDFIALLSATEAQTHKLDANVCFDLPPRAEVCATSPIPALPEDTVLVWLKNVYQP